MDLKKLAAQIDLAAQLASAGDEASRLLVVYFGPKEEGGAQARRCFHGDWQSLDAALNGASIQAGAKRLQEALWPECPPTYKLQIVSGAHMLEQMGGIKGMLGG